MPLRYLSKKYRNIGRRVAFIAQVFIGHGFGHLVTEMGLHKALPFRTRWSRRFGPQHEPDTVAVRLRMAFEELGPTFIKFGQVLSGRPDLITHQFADELAKLRDEVPPFPFEQARRIIEEDLQGELESLFLEFDKVPIAAASMAQVHNAVLPDGTPVVVKVRRPGIEKALEQDAAILTGIANLAEKHFPESRMYNPTGIVEEFKRTIKREMDFTIEADNAIRFGRNFKDSDTIYIPAVFADYSSRRVLTLERISGIRINDAAKLDAAGFDRGQLAVDGARAFFKQVFEDGFFHADPHAGNLFVMEDGKIAFLDFGQVGRLTTENMELIADTFLALVNKDFDALVQQYINLGFVPENVDVEKFHKEFKRDLIDLIEPLYGKAIGRISMSDYITQVIDIAHRHGLKFPRELVLMNKALFTIEGIGRELDPEFDFLGVAKPYAASLLTRKYSPKRFARRVNRSARNFIEFVDSLPRHLRVIFGLIKRGEITVKMEVQHLERFIKEFDRSTNRLSFALIISGITVASAIIIHSGRGRIVFGYPILGFVGYVMAAFLGLWLVWGIIRSGRL